MGAVKLGQDVAWGHHGNKALRKHLLAARQFGKITLFV
jgi:hypothetical protein